MCSCNNHLVLISSKETFVQSAIDVVVKFCHITSAIYDKKSHWHSSCNRITITKIK